MTKTLLFTTELTPKDLPEGNFTLGIVGEIDPSTYPQDGIKRVPALKLVKAMKQMSNKEDYCVMGDPKYVEAGKKLGFQTEEEPEEEEEKEKSTPEVLTKLASELIELDTKYKELTKEHEELKTKHQGLEEEHQKLQNIESELKQKYEDDLKAEREDKEAELEHIKQLIKNIIKE